MTAMSTFETWKMDTKEEEWQKMALMYRVISGSKAMGAFKMATRVGVVMKAHGMLVEMSGSHVAPSWDFDLATFGVLCIIWMPHYRKGVEAMEKVPVYQND